MARLSVYVPDDLVDRLKTERPGANVSALLQAALRGAVGCQHDDFVCECCGLRVARGAVEHRAMDTLWSAIFRRLEAHVHARGSVEGAVTVAKAAATEAGASSATRSTLPRLTQTVRQADEVEAHRPRAKRSA